MRLCTRIHYLTAVAAVVLSGAVVEARERGPIAPSYPVVSKAEAAARPAEVRVIYYSGDVELSDSSTAMSLVFGMLVDSLHAIDVGRGASVQLAVDGRVVVLDRAGRFSRTDIVRRARGEKNEEMTSALRLLAEKASLTSSSAASTARIQAAFVAAMVPEARVTSSQATGMLVPLEPRTSAVTRGPVHFRWLNAANDATYRVVVRDRFDQEMLRHETTDTSFVWESAVLFAGPEYSWTLTRLDHPTDSVTSTFHRLDDLQGMRLEGGESRIRLALGSENPALPLVLGAHFASFGCYADAARYFTIGALRTPEHFDRFLRLAREQYDANVGLSASELEHVQTVGAITMSE